MVDYPGHTHTSSEESSSAQLYVGRHDFDFGHYSTEEVHKTTKKELGGKLNFNRPNVLYRLRIQDVDDELVYCLGWKIEKDEGFTKSKSTLEKLSPKNKTRAEVGTKNLTDNVNDKKQLRARKKTMRPLKQTFNCILELAVAHDNGQTVQYKRMWLARADIKLPAEDTLSFPQVKPEFTLCETYKEVVFNERKKGWEVCRRHRMTFVKVEATINQGPEPVEENTVKTIFSQSVDYTRLHLMCRSLLVYSVRLLIFGRQSCLAIFDRDGVQFSSIRNTWDNLDILIRIIRHMSHEMSPVNLGQDPNINAIPSHDPNSVACRKLAIARAKGGTDLINQLSDHPTYTINFCNTKYYTVGIPVWTSLSPLGTSPTESLATGIFKILKTAWRQSNRPSESAIMQHIKGSHDGLIQYSQGSDVFFPSNSLVAPHKITAANLRNMNSYVEGNTTILRRLILETVGRPIWEFDSYLEFFLAIKAALNAHKFLADQNILHGNISAENVLLSSNPNVPDSQKGFLTDSEFARIDDKTLETKGIIAVPPLPNPNRAKEMTEATTRTHTTWTPTPRGAVITGTIQFMALELVSSLAAGSQPIHRVYHDVESFIWVMYYGILRRIGYVGRNLTGETIPAGLRNISQKAFKKLFNYVDPNTIASQRTLPIPNVIFYQKEILFPLPIQQFFRDVHILVGTMRVQGPGHGQATHEEILVILERVIAGLR